MRLSLVPEELPRLPFSAILLLFSLQKNKALQEKAAQFYKHYVKKQAQLDLLRAAIASSNPAAQGAQDSGECASQEVPTFRQPAIECCFAYWVLSVATPPLRSTPSL